MSERTEAAVFTCMVMVEDENGRVLVERKVGSGWDGLVFPGGHIERGELFTDGAVREIREETGLTVMNPRLIGVKQFITSEYRYVVFLYKASESCGELRSSDEGEVFWMTKEALLARRDEMPRTFYEMATELFFGEKYSEFGMIEDVSTPSGWIQIFK